MCSLYKWRKIVIKNKTYFYVLSFRLVADNHPYLQSNIFEIGYLLSKLKIITERHLRRTGLSLMSTKLFLVVSSGLFFMTNNKCIV